jgi:phosphoribosylformylglycinamidine cyclo-ligase
VSPENAQKVTDALTAEGETVFALGRMVARAEDGHGTIYKGTLGL